MTLPVKRGRPLRVSFTLVDPLDEATLRALAFVDHTSVAVQARTRLIERLSELRSSSPELVAAARLLVDMWDGAEHGVHVAGGKAHLRVVVE